MGMGSRSFINSVLAMTVELSHCVSVCGHLLEIPLKNEIILSGRDLKLDVLDFYENLVQLLVHLGVRDASDYVSLNVCYIERMFCLHS